MPVTPGEVYVLTIYNLDYIPGAKPRLRKGLEGDHRWYLNSGIGEVGGYEDYAFKVYSKPGPLPLR